MEYDGHSGIKVLRAISPVSAGGAQVGQEIDTKGFESCEFVIATGALGAGTSLAIVEQSPDDGTGSPTGVWTAVPADETLGGDGGAGTLGTIVATDDNAVFRIGTIGKERFQRLTLPATTGFTTFLCAAVAILSNPKVQPVANQN